jgi:hypothetical protein
VSRPLPFDETALRTTAQIEREIVRLDLDCQGEFVALINAIEMQIESGQPVQAVIGYLSAALVALAHARGVDQHRLKLADQLRKLDLQLFRNASTR